MKVMKKILALLLSSIIIVCAISTPVRASTYIGYTTKKNTLWLFNPKLYVYRAYFDANVIHFYYGMPLSYIPYHVKNTGNVTLEVCQSASLSYSKTTEYNESIGADVGIKGIVTLSAERGYGVSNGFSISYTASMVYSKTIETSAPTGFYMLAPAITSKKCHWEKFDSDYNYLDSGTYYMPYGTPIITVLYSPNNRDWNIHNK